MPVSNDLFSSGVVFAQAACTELMLPQTTMQRRQRSRRCDAQLQEPNIKPSHSKHTHIIVRDVNLLNFGHCD